MSRLWRGIQICNLASTCVGFISF
uniref:Uncharacterized protein n=1 Tax=Rhizophora mucronata TaxID=61149 RepID=A0A2P2R3L3_RHIMU